MFSDPSCVKWEIDERGKFSPSHFIDENALIQVVGPPNSGKTIFSYFLSQHFDQRVWITREDSFSLDIPIKVSLISYEDILYALESMKNVDDLVCVIDPIFDYVFEEKEKKNFFKELGKYSSQMPIIFINKFMYRDKRIFRKDMKMWGGDALRVVSDYIFVVRKMNEYVKEDSIIMEIEVDVLKSLKGMPESGIPLTFKDGLIYQKKEE